MSKTLLPLNTCADGTALSLVAGYYKFYLATFFRWGGTAGTCVAEIEEADADVMSCAFRGRSKGDWRTSSHYQQLEILGGEFANSITSVAKDSLIIEIYKTNVFGLSRTRDSAGKVVKRTLNPYVNCLHASCGGGFENMWVLVVEVYEGLCDTIREDRSDEATP